MLFPREHVPIPRGGYYLARPTLALSSQISVHFTGTMDDARISEEPRGGLFSREANDKLADLCLTTDELARELEALDVRRSVRFPQTLCTPTDL